MKKIFYNFIYTLKCQNGNNERVTTNIVGLSNRIRLYNDLVNDPNICDVVVIKHRIEGEKIFSYIIKDGSPF